MKIIFLVSSLGAGGAERVATTLCNAWAARGDQVTLVPTFSGGGEQFYKVSKDIDLVYLADLAGSREKSFWGNFRRLIFLRKLIDKKKPDFVISFLPNVNVAAILATRFFSVPVICCERRDPSSQPTTLLWEFACRITYPLADMLVVQTRAVEHTIGHLYPNLKRVRTVANPIPVDVISITKENVDKERKTLLSLGRLSDEKQVATIILAFSELANDYPEWDLYIYGDGPMRDQLERQIDSLGLVHRIFFGGKSSTPWSVMAESDAFVMASKFEGFPNALLEAMAVGLPCVAFDCPSGPKDITLEGKDAFLVPLNDKDMLIAKIRELMNSEILRNEMGSQARDSVIARYCLPVVLAEWDSLFIELGTR